ncbi:MAG: hypothetical protein ABIR36_16855 [Nitrospiraceae bacterium]
MDTTRTNDRELIGMERVVVDLLRDGVPRTLDDMTGALPGDCCVQVFLTVDRLSREGLVRIMPGVPDYRVTLANGGNMR